MTHSDLKLGEAALIGLAGRFLEEIGPETEADPAGILIRFLATFGNMVGPGPHFWVESDKHHPIINVVTVGSTSRGRKGVGAGRVRRITHEADPLWAKRDINGHASGEAIIADLAPSGDEGATSDPRLLINESEFSRFIKVAGRDGSILSDTTRNLYDGLPVSNRRAKERVVANKHHVTIIGSITQAELARVMSDTDALNGFANRFLWVLVERARRLPHGGHITDGQISHLVEATQDALKEARKVNTMARSIEAAEIWADFYLLVPDDRPGLWGAATARAEAMVLRLSMIYALLDGLKSIEPRHVQAAMAVWDYCDQSARLIFGDQVGHQDADKLLDHLRAVGSQGITRTEQQALFHRNGTRAGGARQLLIKYGLAIERDQPTGGAPAQFLYLLENDPQNTL